MVSGRDALPLFSQGHHGSGIKDAESKQMVELKANPIHGPVEATFSIKEWVSLWCENGQMLHISPGQLRAVGRNKQTKRNIMVNELGNWGKSFMVYFASRARAKTPAASGAAAEVPEWVLVHLPYKSVVA